MNEFFTRLQSRWDAGARVWVGLDPAWDKLPYPYNTRPARQRQLSFNRNILNRTVSRALFVKANFWFNREDIVYTLRETCKILKQKAPDVPFVVDAKIGDIDNTNEEAAHLIFNVIGADGVTLNPYTGGVAFEPFLKRKDKGLFFLCRTSNKGADEFQNLEVRHRVSDHTAIVMPLYEKVALDVAQLWNGNGNCGLVVGATLPEDELARVRKIVGDMWILAPGIGRQGGDLEKTIRNGLNSKGSGIAAGSASSIIFNPMPGVAVAKLTHQTNRALRTMEKVPAGCGAG